MVALNAEVPERQLVGAAHLPLLPAPRLPPYPSRNGLRQRHHSLRLQKILLPHAYPARGALLAQRGDGQEEAGIAEPASASWAEPWFLCYLLAVVAVDIGGSQFAAPYRLHIYCSL